MKKITNFYSYSINIVLAFFFIGLITIPKAYNASIFLAAMGVFLFIFYIFKNKFIISINKDILGFFIIFGTYFFVYLLDVLLHKDSISILDNPSRSLCFLFIFFVLKDARIKLNLLLYVVPLGAISAGVVAGYQVLILGQARALDSSFQMPIQYGDMAMSLAMFCAAMFFYCLDKKLTKLALLNIVGLIGGILASFLSLSRGGWLLMPFILFSLVYLNRRIFSSKMFLLGFLSIFVGIGIFVANHSSVILKVEVAYVQVKQAFNDSQELSPDGSVSPRLALWKAGWIAMQEKPIWGEGKYGAKLKRQQQFEQGILNFHDSRYDHAHNQFINDILERGIIGLCSLLGIFLFPLWKFFQIYKESKNNLDIQLLSILGIIHITSVMSYGLTQVFFAHNSGNMFYFFLIVLFYAMILNFKKVSCVLKDNSFSS